MARLQRMLGLLIAAGAASAKPFPEAASVTITSDFPTVTVSDPPTITNCGTASYEPIIALQYASLSTDPALQCKCLNSLTSWISDPNAPTRTLTRLFGTGLTTVTKTVNGTTSVVTSAVISTDIETVTDNFIVVNTNLFYGSATSPCCYSCTVGAATVDLVYWPTTTGAPAVTSFVSNGYTFQSPSIYIGFSSLSAFDFCGQVGQAFVNTTVAFNPEELSTIKLALVVTNPSTADATQTPFYTSVGVEPLNYADLQQNCSTIDGYTFIAGNPSNIGQRSPDPCNPTIVLPERVKSLDPAWKSCVADGIGGFYDPPSALNPVTPPAQTTAPPPPATTTLDNPAPGSSTPTDPTPPVTSPAPPAESSPAPPAESSPAPPAESSPAPPAESSPAPPAESSPAPPAESSPAPPAESSPAPPAESSPAPPAESSPAPPAESSPAPPAESNPLPPNSPSTPVNTPPPPPTGVNNNGGSPPPATQSNPAGNGNGNGNGNTGGTVPPTQDSGDGTDNVPPPADQNDGSGSGSGSGSVPDPNDPAVTPVDASPSGAPAVSSVTVSQVTIVTTNGGSGSGAAGGSGNSTGTAPASGDSPDGSATAAPTVVRADAASLMSNMMGLAGIAVAMLFATLL